MKRQYIIDQLIHLQMRLTMYSRHEEWYAETIKLLVNIIEEIKQLKGGRMAKKETKEPTWTEKFGGALKPKVTLPDEIPAPKPKPKGK